eukprot:gene45943-60508_t
MPLHWPTLTLTLLHSLHPGVRQLACATDPVAAAVPVAGQRSAQSATQFGHTPTWAGGHAAVHERRLRRSCTAACPPAHVGVCPNCVADCADRCPATGTAAATGSVAQASCRTPGCKLCSKVSVNVGQCSGMRMDGVGSMMIVACSPAGVEQMLYSDACCTVFEKNGTFAADKCYRDAFLDTHMRYECGGSVPSNA